MLFNSWIFVVLLLVTFVVYYGLLRFRLGVMSQVFILLLSSLVFYAHDNISLVVLLLLSITVNYFASKYIVRSSDGRVGKRWACLVVVFNLCVLAFFKYASLICKTLIPAQYLSGEFFSYIQDIPLPVGISFYTFQAISLVVDLRRHGKVSGVEKLEDDFHQGKNVKSYFNIAFYIAFFPQLIAGPIVKAHDFIRQIEVKKLTGVDWNLVTRSLIVGYFLKMYVADNLKEVTVLLNNVDLYTLPKVSLITLFYAYSFQIFADFAGYSLIAIGLAALFGYRLPANFNYPYISKSVTEFWRRWHISLSSWLREYLYIPLGGNRKGPLRTYFNLMLVMTLGGLWHGAAWSYMLWGGAHGVILASERLWNGRKSATEYTPSIVGDAFKVLITFHVVSLLWLLFVMPDMSNVYDYFSALLTSEWKLGSPRILFVTLMYGLPVVVYHLYAYVREAAKKFDGYGTLSNWGNFFKSCEVTVLSGMLFLVVTNSGTTGAFIYFQF